MVIMIRSGIHQVWAQTSNPHEQMKQGARRAGVEGYRAIEAPHHQFGWGGLQWDGGAGKPPYAPFTCLMAGAVGALSVQVC